jgi:hypothetical protein
MFLQANSKRGTGVPEAVRVPRPGMAKVVEQVEPERPRDEAKELAAFVGQDWLAVVKEQAPWES